MPPSNNNNNTPRPWGSQCACVSLDSTGQRDFIQGFAFMESDDEEGLSWQHVEDISILAPEEEDFSTGATGRNRESGFKNGGTSGSGSGSAEGGGSKKGSFGSAKEGCSKKSFFGFGAKGKGKDSAGKK